MTDSNSKLIRNSTAEFLIFTAPAGEQSIEARYEDQTVWLTRKLMAELFAVDVRTVSEHLKNIFSSGELGDDSVIRKFRITAADGKPYATNHYNLDAIISIGYLIVVAAVLGTLMVAEALLALWFGWSRFGLGSDESGLYTFSFLTLLYFAALSIVSARERRWFWMTMPSKLVVAAVVAETLIGTSLMFVGLPGLAPVPWWEALAIFGYAAVSCLVVNEVVKVALINWHRPAGIAGMQATLRTQIATRAYELYEHHGYSDGHADQDWLQAESEIRKEDPGK